MCLTTHKSGEEKHGVFRAGYDILVWKQLDEDAGWRYSKQKGRYCWLSRGLRSPYQNTPYKLNKMMTAPRFSIMSGYYSGQYSVHKGLHAYTSDYDKESDFYPAIIPKGTLFIPGTCGEVVALALIVHGKRWLKQRKGYVPKRGKFDLHKRVMSIADYMRQNSGK